jgi:uracil-DNA glycosylase family 4
MLMFIGEGPGAMEDAQGLPFVGPAGQLLDRMLAAINLERSQVYIANVVKCRPPGNRVPLPDEIMACKPFLRGQVALIRPKIIVALGATAAKVVFKDENFRITRQRGVWKEATGVKLLATYHPSYLLRSPEHKKEAWEDMQAIQKALEALS